MCTVFVTLHISLKYTVLQLPVLKHVSMHLEFFLTSTKLVVCMPGMWSPYFLWDPNSDSRVKKFTTSDSDPTKPRLPL